MPQYSIFRRLVSLLLAALVLTASVGLTVKRYTCQVSGHSVVGVEVAAQGNRALPGCFGPSPPGKALAKNACCDSNSHLHKLSAPAQELTAETPAPAPLLAVWLPATAGPLLPTGGGRDAGVPRWFAADSSPPRVGRGLLAFVCIWME